MAKGWIEKTGKDRWRICVSNGFDRNGRQVVVRRRIRVETRREADRELRSLLETVERQKFVPSAKTTFKDLVDQWLSEHVDRHLAVRTTESYRAMLPRILDAFGNTRLDKLEGRTIGKFLNDLKQRAGGRRTAEHLLSDRTVLHYYRLLSAILKFGILRGMIATNPLDHCVAPKVRHHEEHTVTASELSMILEKIESESPMFRLLVLLALATGARRGELVGLQWGDIDLDNRKISIRRAVVYTKKHGIVVTAPKTPRSRRTFTFPAMLVPVFQKHRANQTASGVLSDADRSASDFIFTGSNGRILFPDTASRWWIRFRKENGLDGVKLHGLRHANATLQVEAGIPITTISKRLGHIRTSTTLNSYAHALDHGDQLAAERLDELLTKRHIS